MNPQEYDELFEPEELDPELAIYSGQSSFGSYIKHPLAFSVPHMPQLNKQMNAFLRHKKELIAKAESESRWGDIPVLYERPHRLECVLKYADRMTAAEYWEALHWVWIDTENVWQHKRAWVEALRSQRPGSIMTPDDAMILAGLPERLTIYRGCDPSKNWHGLSWTLSKERANWFAMRLRLRSDARCVRVREVRRKDVYALITSRNEQEIIMLPRRTK